MLCSMNLTDGSPALVGHYLVDMLPQTSMFSSEEHFVSNGRQRLPLAGISSLQPGDVLGTASAPLLQIPLSSVPCDDSDDELPDFADENVTAPEPCDSGEWIPGPVPSTKANNPVCPIEDPFVYNLHERPNKPQGDGPRTWLDTNRHYRSRKSFERVPRCILSFPYRFRFLRSVPFQTHGSAR